MDLLTSIMARGGYLPHGYCFTWTPGLLWTMVGADTAIAAAYFSIPLAILTFVRRRAERSNNAIAWLFCAFIFACGVTHVMDVWTIWVPDYGLQALVKTVTAFVSLATAVLLWPLLPKALAIPTVARLQTVIASLEAEIGMRRSAEEHLVDSEQTLAVTLASIGAGFIATDRQGRVSGMNAVAEATMGWTEPEALGRSYWEVFVRENRPAGFTAMNAIEVMIEQGFTVEMAHDVVAVSRGGTRHSLEVKAALTHNKDGTVRGMAIVFRDTTALARAEAEAARLAAIVQSSQDAIISKTLDGVITSWNGGAERLFGYAAEEAVGQSIHMLIPEDHAAEEIEILARLAKGETVDHFETVRRRRDGTLVDVSTTISPVRDAAGRVVGASKIARDITERKRADERLHAQLQRLRLLDQITRAIGERQDLQSIYQVAVRSLEDQLPVDFSCVMTHEPGSDSLVVTGVGVGRHGVGAVLSPQSTVEVDANGLSRCLDGETVYEPDTSAVPYPFARRLYAAGLGSMVMAPLQSESRVFGVLLTARRDPEAFSSAESEFIRQLSSHVALAAHHASLHGALQGAFDELRQTQQAVMHQERLRALGQMASGIAHDINNAISPAVLYAESLLEREPLSERARGYVESIARAVDDVAATVARMREFYRAREPQLALMPVLLNELVRQVIDLSRARWSDMPLQRGVVIEISTSLGEQLPVVWGVESELREALINLVFNAVDAMPDGGILTLRTRLLAPLDPNGEETPHGEWRLALEVADTGAGMDETTRRRCLEPFFTTKGERGTGLGLAMVYGTAQRHGADIHIESAPGVGTVVQMAFPVKTLAAAEPVQRVGKLAERLNILLVDDDPVLLHSLRDTLEGDGHVAQAATGGQAGIDAFTAAFDSGRPFDIVITDLGMPHVDGRMVAAAVKRCSPSTPVMMLTGWGQRMTDEGETPASVDVVLSKPPRLNDLRAGLSRCRQRGPAR